MSLVWLMQYVILPLLALAAILTFIRLSRGPTLPDRVIALDLLATFGIAMLAAYALVTKETAYLDVGLLLALVSFMGTVAFGTICNGGMPDVDRLPVYSGCDWNFVSLVSRDRHPADARPYAALRSQPKPRPWAWVAYSSPRHCNSRIYR